MTALDTKALLEAGDREELCAAAPRLAREHAALCSALERLHRNFGLLLAGKPVRDVAETDAEVRAALKGEGDE